MGSKGREDTRSTVWRKQGGSPVFVLSSNNRHCHTNLCRVLKIFPVSPPKHTIHLRRQPKEPELNFKVSKAIILRHLVVVNCIIFFGHWHNIHQYLSNILKGHYHTVPGCY
ncbi:hypothetical protein V8G54_022521, partial [Vigna mungo]